MKHELFNCMCNAEDELLVERALDGIWLSIANEGVAVQRVKLTLEDATTLQKFLTPVPVEAEKVEPTPLPTTFFATRYARSIKLERSSCSKTDLFLVILNKDDGLVGSTHIPREQLKELKRAINQHLKATKGQ